MTTHDTDHWLTDWELMFTPQEQKAPYWWEQDWRGNMSYDEWLVEWHKTGSLIGAFALLDGLLGLRGYRLEGVRFLFHLMRDFSREEKEMFASSRSEESPPEAVQRKAIEVFTLRFLKDQDKSESRGRESIWPLVFCKDAEEGGDLFARTVAYLGQHSSWFFDSETHHYRSVVKRFLMNCLDHRQERVAAVSIPQLVEACRPEFCRALLVYGLEDRIGDKYDSTEMLEKWMAVLSAIVFEKDWQGRKPRDLREALVDSLSNRSVAAARLIYLDELVKAKKRAQREKEIAERIALIQWQLKQIDEKPTRKEFVEKPIPASEVRKLRSELERLERQLPPEQQQQASP